MREVYLDNAATAEKDISAIYAEEFFYKKTNANPLRGLYKKSVQAATGVNKTRECILELVHADKSYTVIFSRGTTEALNLVANGLVKGADGFGVVPKTTKVVVDIESHHSNILPWKQRYKNVVIAKELSKKELSGAGVISLTGVSNVTGEQFLERIETVRAAYPKAILGIDGAQMVGHVDFDIKRLGADYVAFSGHKFGAPMGIGGLIIKKELAEKLRPLIYGGGAVDSVSLDGEPVYSDIPERLEAGTLPVGAIHGLREVAAKLVKYHIKSDRVDKLVKYTAMELREIEGVEVLAANGSILTFQVKGVHPHDVAQILADEGIMVRAGWLCAEPFLRYKGWGPVVRASFSKHNDTLDKDALVAAVKTIRDKMGLTDV